MAIQDEANHSNPVCVGVGEWFDEGMYEYCLSVEVYEYFPEIFDKCEEPPVFMELVNLDGTVSKAYEECYMWIEAEKLIAEFTKLGFIFD